MCILVWMLLPLGVMILRCVMLLCAPVVHSSLLLASVSISYTLTIIPLFGGNLISPTVERKYSKCADRKVCYPSYHANNFWNYLSVSFEKWGKGPGLGTQKENCPFTFWTFGRMCERSSSLDLRGFDNHQNELFEHAPDSTGVIPAAALHPTGTHIPPLCSI